MPMMSGRDALLQIDAALAEERQRIEGVDQRIKAASDERLELQRARAENLRELARLRVGMIAGGSLAAGLDAADRQVAALLASRPAAQAALEERIQAASQHRSALEAERSAQADALEVASGAVDAAEAVTQAGPPRGRARVPGPAGAHPRGRARCPARRGQGHQQHAGARAEGRVLSRRPAVRIPLGAELRVTGLSRDVPHPVARRQGRSPHRLRRCLLITTLS
jgi:hypothetical protein